MNEDPFHFQTWSGSSRYFFEALKKRGVLVSAVSAEPGPFARRFCQIKTFDFDIEKWKFAYNLSADLFGQMSKVAKSKIDKLDKNYNVILQVGAWYDLISDSRINVSYHDGNFATRLSSPFGIPNVSKDTIAKALDYERDLYSRMDLIFPMSEWLANSFVRDFGVPAEKVKPVGAGINLAKVLDTSGRRYSGKTLLMVGKNFKRKGGDSLLVAFEKVRNIFPEARLRIIGPTLENVPPGVECLGLLSKNSEVDLEILLKEYRAATVFVMPSLYEPFGISFVEAMAHRLPCVGTNICAMPEIIVDGETGYLVNPNDPDMLADRLVKLLSSEEQCRSFGNAGYRRYMNCYTWEIVATKIEGEVRKLVEEKFTN